MDWLGRPHLAILGGKEEDRLTAYWAELLRAPEVLGRFLNDLCGLSLTPAQLPSPRTQVTIPGGRPDLAIRGESHYLLFEAKVGSWLHEGQLTPYAQELEQWRHRHPSGTAALFLLIPQRNMAALLQNAERELSDAGLSGWRPTPIAWEQVGVLCGSLKDDVTDRRLAMHLAEFADIIAYRLGELLRPFTAEECVLLEDPLAARTLQRAWRLVDRVANLLLTKGFSISVSRGNLFNGYNIQHNNGIWWYGVWVDAWEKVGVSPIFLQLSGLEDRPAPSLPEDLPPPVSIQFGKLQQVVPLPIRNGVELEVLAQEQAEVLLRYATEASMTGGSRPATD